MEFVEIDPWTSVWICSELEVYPELLECRKFLCEVVAEFSVPPLGLIGPGIDRSIDVYTSQCISLEDTE